MNSSKAEGLGQSDPDGGCVYFPPPEGTRVVHPVTERSSRTACFHCGLPSDAGAFRTGDKSFCCQGCRTVFDLLNECGLTGFYQLSPAAGIRVETKSSSAEFTYLDESSVRERIVNFSNGQITTVTFHIPSIHCIACVWLLENLFRLKPGIGVSRVNFPRREVTITFTNGELKLSELAHLLASIGYEPALKFSDLEERPRDLTARQLWLQLGIAGFAFGNIMLLSIASYAGLDSWSGPRFERLFGYLSLVLSAPVVVYSASSYWKSAWTSLRQRLLTIEVPIAAGIIALFAQSTYDVLSGRGLGYFDSLTGLLFFLLCGKLFQQKRFDSLAFDRDYRSFFPLSASRRVKEPKDVRPALSEDDLGEERISLSQIQPGDCLVIRHGELISADARLVSASATIDYSFVTGESEPVQKNAGDYLYSGGRQVGNTIDVEVLKPVSQSYLTSLWNQEAFRKSAANTLDTLTNRYSQRFTKIVIAVAIGAAVFWAVRDPSRAIYSFTSVLIVACPCALALGAPFTLGTALRLLSRSKIFLKNAGVIETLARIDTVVFDKTGTLTSPQDAETVFSGAPLTLEEERSIYSIARSSVHPYAIRICRALRPPGTAAALREFRETVGAGIEGKAERSIVSLGSAAWLASRGIAVPPRFSDRAGISHLAIDGQYRGSFVFTAGLRPETESLISQLSSKYELALLSGDNDQERCRFGEIFGKEAHLRFHQSPLDKLEFIQNLQKSGKTVMMVGDGLNDAGAFQQSNAGVAVVEQISTFSPASDAIVPSEAVGQLGAVLKFSKQCVRIVRLSFLISALYNVIGISIAAQGLLSPIVCAILMPLSSLTVVSIVCGLANWCGRRCGLVPIAAEEQTGKRFPYSFRRTPDSLGGLTPEYDDVCGKVFFAQARRL